MPTSTDITNLKINQLTEAQYDTAVQGGVIGANELSILTDAEVGQTIQVDVLPTASADELGKIYQFIGTTDTNYTNGFFYKCVSDGATPAMYSWEAVEVQASSGGGLPSQTGNAGKFLTTDGTDASWSDKPLANTATGSNSLTISGSPNSNANSVNIGIGSVAGYNGVSIGCNAGKNTSSSVNITESIFIGMGAQAFRNSTDCRCSIGIGQGAEVKDAKGGISIGWGSGVYSERAIGIGYNARASAFHSIQLGSPSSGTAFNNDANTFKVANANGNFEIMSANGTIPTDRFTTTPSADGTYNATITVANGVVTRSWASGGSGGGVSDVTVNGTSVVSGGVAAITGMVQNTTTGTDSLTILGTATSADYAVNIGVGSVSSNEGDVAIGYNAQANGGQEYSTAVGFDARAVAPKSVALGGSAQVGSNANGSVVIGSSATATKSYSVSIGNYAGVTGWGAIQLGGYDVTNSEAGTFYVGLTPNNSSDTVNYKLLDSDGTIPTARLTKVNSTITLTAAGWSNGSQTVNVTGMTATGVVLVSPDPTDQADYTSAGIICSAQASGTLTFTCSTTPVNDIDVVVVML